MDDVQKLILARINEVKKEMNDGFEKINGKIGKVHSRIDELDKLKYKIAGALILLSLGVGFYKIL